MVRSPFSGEYYFGCNKCETCFKTFHKLCIHHIDGNHNNNIKENLINICWECHAVIHKGINKRRSRTYKKEPCILNRLIELRNIWLSFKYPKNLILNEAS